MSYNTKEALKGFLAFLLVVLISPWAVIMLGRYIDWVVGCMK